MCAGASDLFFFLALASVAPILHHFKHFSFFSLFLAVCVRACVCV